MKVIEIENTSPTLEEVVDLAKQEIVVLRQSNGKLFVVSQVDDFDVEVELLKNNPEFMALMQELSNEQTTISSKQLREELGL